MLNTCMPPPPPHTHTLGKEETGTTHPECARLLPDPAEIVAWFGLRPQLVALKASEGEGEGESGRRGQGEGEMALLGLCTLLDLVHPLFGVLPQHHRVGSSSLLVCLCVCVCAHTHKHANANLNSCPPR